MSRRPTSTVAVPVVLCAVAFAVSVQALETDQYWSWHRPLADSTDAVNAWFNLAVTRVLDEAAQGSPDAPLQCEEVRNRIGYRLEFEIFQDVELWAFHSSLVHRLPDGPEEVDRFEAESIHANHPWFDIGNWLPHSRPSRSTVCGPVPTSWRTSSPRGGSTTGFTAGGWERRRPGRGVRVGRSLGRVRERGINGLLAIGVFSRGDMEANASGLRFYIDLCDGSDPYLGVDGGRWVLRRSIDLAEYVTPEWDESYQNSIYAAYRWKLVRPMLLAHCPDLADPSSRRGSPATAWSTVRRRASRRSRRW